MSGHVFVGIVVYNSLVDLPRCLAALEGQTYRNFSLIFLDNCSQDGSLEWLHDRPYPVIANGENVGFSRAHNQILATCNLTPQDYYMPVNPDVILEPNYIETLVCFLESVQAGWVTGKLLLGDHRIYSVGHAISRDGYAINIGCQLQDAGQFDSPCEIFGAPAVAILISQKLIAAIAPGGELFDAHMFLYGEDVDLDWRARLQGWKCWYVPAAVGFHRGSNPGEELRAQALTNRYLSVIKNAYLVDLTFYNLPLILLHCLARLILTPATGFAIAGRLFRLAPLVWRKRQPPKVPRREIQRWFKDFHHQITGQPVSWIQRGRWFFKRQFNI